MHIVDIEEEKKRQEIQNVFDKNEALEKYDRIYKPTYTLEFDRCGELLVYSGTPIKYKTLYTQYPYVLYESIIPLALFMFYMNPLELTWYFNYLNIPLMVFLTFPRAWHLWSFSFRIKKMWLLRGGKVVKVERTSLAGDTFTDWAEVRYFKPITEDFQKFDDKDEADFLNQEGQLKYELATELDHFKHYGVTEQDVNLFFMKEGTVHHPEVFEAIVKGYHIETSDFVINTANLVRAKEPDHNV
jgi:hypothetical protein